MGVSVREGEEVGKVLTLLVYSMSCLRSPFEKSVCGAAVSTLGTYALDSDCGAERARKFKFICRYLAWRT
jgi:hypothetical protein